MRDFARTTFDHKRESFECRLSHAFNPISSNSLTPFDICVVNNSLLLTQECDRYSLQGVKSM
jgi:hypothetical protein